MKNEDADLIADISHDDDFLEREVSRGDLLIGRSVEGTQSMGEDHRHVVQVDDADQTVRLQVQTGDGGGGDAGIVSHG